MAYHVHPHVWISFINWSIWQCGHRSPSATNPSVGQMTIFYCGKVNVYDGVPTDKVMILGYLVVTPVTCWSYNTTIWISQAQAIMHLAASPIHLPQDDALCGAAAVWSPCHLQISSDKDHLIPPCNNISQIMQTGNFFKTIS